MTGIKDLVLLIEELDGSAMRHLRETNAYSVSEHVAEILEEQQIRGDVLGALGATGSLSHSSALSAIESLDHATRLEEVIRTATMHDLAARHLYGPAEDYKALLGQVGLDAHSALALQTETLTESLCRQFTLPSLFDANSYLDQTLGSVATQMAFLDTTSAEVMRAIEGMRHPWVDTDNIASSVRGFAGLQSIGHALSSHHAFDSSIANGLRDWLGTWNSSIIWNDDQLEDLETRSEFYEDQGYDSALSDFPNPAFEEALELAGLRTPSPTLFQTPTVIQSSEFNSGLERTNKAHRQLFILECSLRQFIEVRMQIGFGDGWVKSRVPVDMRQKWEEKRDNAVAHGENPLSLIHYADFTDYEKIILRRDNWRDIFAPVFNRREFIIESFYRLRPIRLCTAHARVITQDDEVFLYVEAKRIISVICDHPSH